MLGKQEYFCRQVKDYNKGKKNKYIEKKNAALKQGHVFTKSRKHTQPIKKLDCPVKFCVKKINQNLRDDLETLKKSKKNCENLGSLQCLVIF